ncbi:hypothetical protein Hanom_Chr09g00801451 [Helianthus anomalus]
MTQDQRLKVDIMRQEKSLTVGAQKMKKNSLHSSLTRQKIGSGDPPELVNRLTNIILQ